MPESGCPLCHRSEVEPWFEKNRCTVCRCPECGLVFTAGEWSSRDAHAFYGASYFCGHEAGGYSNYAGLEIALRITAEARLRRLPAGDRLLDLGCGPGVFAAAAADRFRAFGSDVSVAACRAARERGLNVVVNDAVALPFADATYDVVTMWDTIEHLADPLVALREVFRILRPGGTLVLSTGDVASLCARLSRRHWHLFTLPEHRYFFSLPTLDRFLARAGFERSAAYHIGGHYSPAYLLERLLKSLGGSSRWIDFLLRRPRLNRATLYVNLFDIVTVEARRPAERSVVEG